MKLLLMVMLLSSCTTYRTVFSCGYGETATHYEEFRVSNPGEGVMTKFVTIDEGCTAIDSINYKKAAIKR